MENDNRKEMPGVTPQGTPREVPEMPHREMPDEMHKEEPQQGKKWSEISDPDASTDVC